MGTRTSEALSFVAADVEVSQNGECWLPMSCHSTAIAVAGGDRATGEVNVFCDERPVVKAGKKASQDVTIRFLYTEEPAATTCVAGMWTDGGPFETIRLWDDAVGGEIWVRYWPKGKAAANFVFETGQAIITSFLDPAGEAGAGDPVPGEVVVKTEELTKSAWVS